MTDPHPSEPIRLAVVGGRRGQAFDAALATLSDDLVLTAVCDSDPGVLSDWTARHPGTRGHRDYDALLADPAVDAVFIATPLQLHARQAIAALNAGKHVLSEVVAADTIDDAWELVETVERTGLTYMLAENYCYMRPNLMVRAMAAAGALGRLTHLEGAYLHDCRHLFHHQDGSLTWRGDLQRQASSIFYPTHSLGPVAQWLRAANGPDDRLETVSAFTTAVASAAEHFAARFGPDHPGAATGAWAQGDSATAMITTTSGALITIRVDVVSPRPHNMTHYAAQGTTGAYQSARYDGEDPLVWLAGRSPERLGVRQESRREWETLWQYADEFEDDRWRRHRAAADRSGHGGGDLFVLADFATAVRTGTAPEIDVYDAVTWSTIIPLSIQSLRSGHRPVEIPRFADGRARGQRPDRSTR